MKIHAEFRDLGKLHLLHHNGVYDSFEDAYKDANGRLMIVTRVVDEPEPEPEDEGPWTYAFPLDGSDPYLMISGDAGAGLAESCNIATIRRDSLYNEGLGENIPCYRVDVEGSYDILTLTISAPGHAQVADVYRHLIQVSSKYQ